MVNAAPPPTRLVSLDQFRGYTVLGMYLVNFVGSYTVIAATWPALKHHHTYCSYADTIMPHFVFAAGFALRLVFLRQEAKEGTAAAYRRLVSRNLGLVLLGLVVHGLGSGPSTWAALQEAGWSGFFLTGFKRSLFQTLTHIGVTALWIAPVLRTGVQTRVFFAAACCIVHWRLSDAFYYEWNLTNPVGIDGGLLGFLTWTTPMIAGTIAHDIVTSQSSAAVGRIPRLLAWGALLMVVAYSLSCLNLSREPNAVDPNGGWSARLIEPPFVPPTQPKNYWTMSQRAGSLTYLVFGAGFSFAVYGLFVLVCDQWRVRWSFLDTLGQNALAAYIIHDLVNAVVKSWTPKDSPAWYVWSAFGVSLLLCYLLLRHLEKHRLYLRL